MAAFSSSSSLFQHHHSVMLMDSSLSSSLPVNIIVPDNNYYSTIYSKICADPIDQEPRSSEYFQLSSFINHHHHQPNLGHTSTKLSDLDVIDTNEGSFTTNKNCSTVHFTDQKKNTTMDKKRKSHEGRSSSNSAQSKDLRSSKGKKKQKKAKRGEETEEKDSTGYVHVRARRGQATDSHSLAERVRREKISERMKLLQALVPGCEKVTGKALMLDEIINYVQSLQSQVEFLSMKLASVNPILYDFGMDLESLIARPDQDLNSLPSPLPNMQQCSLRLSTNHYPVFMNNSTGSLQFHHAQYHKGNSGYS